MTLITKKRAAFAKGGCFVYLSAYGKQVHFAVKRLLRVKEVPQSYDDRLACVLCQVPLIRKIAMMG